LWHPQVYEVCSIAVYYLEQIEHSVQLGILRFEDLERQLPTMWR
jgi:hypothetical protein